MSLLDKAIAAITPPESDEARVEARTKAEAAATPGDWLSQVLDHHRQIEAAFDEVANAPDAVARTAAQKKLGTILTGHSIAEEVVLYAAMALTDQKSHAGEAFTEQSAAKVQTAALDDLEPMSQDYLDKLEHLRAAVAHHIYEEEHVWFPRLRALDDPNRQMHLTRRYREEFSRYVGEA